MRRVFILVLASLISITAAHAQSPAASLMKLLQSGRIPKERQGSIVKLICERGNADDLGYIFAEALKPDAFNAQTRLVALKGLAEAAETRKLQPKGDLSRLKSLLVIDKKVDPAIRQAAFALIGLWKVTGLRLDLEKLVLEPKTPAGLRQAALDSLVRMGKESRATIEKLCEADRPTALRFAGVAALTQLDADAAAGKAAQVLARSSDKDDPAPLLAAFFDRKGASDKLAAALGKQKPPVDVAKLCLRYMYSVGRSDAALTAALSNAAGINLAKPVTEEEVKRLVEEVTSKGDPQRGELVFRRLDLSCFNCHSLNGAGGTVGPDLRDVGQSSPPDYIVRSILEPEQAVKEQYETYKILTLDGKLLQGIITEENDARVLLKDATGIIKTIPKADIEERIKGGSLMPRGLANFMTQGELVDLASFLSRLGKPGKYAVQTKPTLRRFRLLKNPAPALVSGVPDSEGLQDHIFNRDEASWQPIYARVDGSLPLDELVKRSGGPKVLYLVGELEAKSAGLVGLKLDAAAGLTLWVDGKPVDVKDSTSCELAAGRHKLLFRIDTSKRPLSTLKVDLMKMDGGADAIVVNGP